MGLNWFVEHAGKGALSGSQSDWPQLKLKTLVLQGTKVTPACLEHLHVLSELEYLDMRCSATLCAPSIPDKDSPARRQSR